MTYCACGYCANSYKNNSVLMVKRVGGRMGSPAPQRLTKQFEYLNLRKGAGVFDSATSSEDTSEKNMRNRNEKLVLLGKLLIAAIAISGLVALAARQLVPSVTFGQLVLYCAVGVVGVMALIILGVICSLQFSQFILRAGGTDAQWFWFPSEPKGLVSLREKQSQEKGAREES